MPTNRAPIVKSSGIRTAGLWCIVGPLLAMASNAYMELATPVVPDNISSYPFATNTFIVAQIYFAITQAMMLMGILGLMRFRAVGQSRLANVGIWLAVIGIGLTVPGELGFALIASSDVNSPGATIVSSFFGLATVVGSLGMIFAGTGTIRTRLWSSWRRFTPLLVGLYYFMVLLPTFIMVEFGNFWAITGWNVCFILLGFALLHHASRVGKEAQMR